MLSPCRSVIVSLCHYVTVSLCLCVIVSLLHCVTLPLCHCVSCGICWEAAPTASTSSRGGERGPVSLCGYVLLCHCVTLLLSLCGCVTVSLWHSAAAGRKELPRRSWTSSRKGSGALCLSVTVSLFYCVTMPLCPSAPVSLWQLLGGGPTAFRASSERGKRGPSGRGTHVQPPAWPTPSRTWLVSPLPCQPQSLDSVLSVLVLLFSISNIVLVGGHVQPPPGQHLQGPGL